MERTQATAQYRAAPIAIPKLISVGRTRHDGESFCVAHVAWSASGNEYARVPLTVSGRRDP